MINDVMLHGKVDGMPFLWLHLVILDSILLAQSYSSVGLQEVSCPFVNSYEDRHVVGNHREPRGAEVGLWLTNSKILKLSGL